MRQHCLIALLVLFFLSGEKGNSHIFGAPPVSETSYRPESSVSPSRRAIGSSHGIIMENSGDLNNALLALDGKQVKIRLYTKEKDPSYYFFSSARVSLDPSQGLLLSFKGANLSPSTIVAVFAGDQSSPAARRAFRDLTYTWTLRHLRPTQDGLTWLILPPKPFSYIPSKPILLRFFDALGIPIRGGKLQLVLSADRMKKTPRILIDIKPTNAGTFRAGAAGGYLWEWSFRLTHPQYGIAEAQVAFDAKEKGVYFPVVLPNSPAAARALKGIVLDPQGKPLEDARISCRFILTLGGGAIHLWSGPSSETGPMACTDEAGRFRYYPFYEKKDEVSEILPPKSRFTVLCMPGKPGLVNHEEEVFAGAEATITAVRGYPHTFRFQKGDREIPIDDLSVFMNVETSDKKKVVLDQRSVRAGCDAPLGIVKPICGSQLSFPDGTITPNSPREITFRIDPSSLTLTYAGRVVHAITGQPQPGVIVFSLGARNISGYVTPEQWKSIHAIPLMALRDSHDLAPLCNSMYLRCITRTGTDGSYSLVATEGAELGLMNAAEENFLQTERLLNDLKPDANHLIHVPDIPLLPAAKMRIRISAPEEDKNRPDRLTFSPEWVLPDENLPEWARPLSSNFGRPPVSFTGVGWLKVNTDQTILMPAGVKYQIYLSVSPEHEQFLPMTIPLDSPPSQGQEIDLGDRKARLAWIALARVLGPSDAPLEGIPVRYGPLLPVPRLGLPKNTDAQGLARFYVAPGSKGVFRISPPVDSPEWAQIDTQVSFETPANPTQVRTYTLRLTKPQLEMLLKDKQ